jgi:hypothetical protein
MGMSWGDGVGADLPCDACDPLAVENHTAKASMTTAGGGHRKTCMGRLQVRIAGSEGITVHERDEVKS